MNIMEMFALMARQLIIEQDIQLMTIDGNDVSDDEIARRSPRKSTLPIAMRNPDTDAPTDDWEPHSFDPQTRGRRNTNIEDYSVEDRIIDNAIKNTTSKPQDTSIGDWMAKFVLATNANDEMAQRVIDLFQPQEIKDDGTRDAIGSDPLLDKMWRKSKNSVAPKILLNMYRWFVESPEHRTQFYKAVQQMDDDVRLAIKNTVKLYIDSVKTSGLSMSYFSNFLRDLGVLDKGVHESVNENVSEHLKRMRKILKYKNGVFK